MLRVVLLGPPGAGKGTQAKRLAAAYGVAHISTGEIFRANVQEGTELGVLAKRYMDAGDLVPDDVTTRMVVDGLSHAPSGYLLDGFPRTIPQAESLERELERRGEPLSAVLAFVLDLETAVKRIAGRRTCAICGRPDNVAFDPPKVPGVCDHCGGELVQRADDEEGPVRRRLEVYRESTEPLLSFYGQRGLLREIDADGTEDEVFERATAALADLVPRRSPAQPAEVR
jgi:adenylate kinase